MHIRSKTILVSQLKECIKVVWWWPRPMNEANSHPLRIVTFNFYTSTEMDCKHSVSSTLHCVYICTNTVV